MNNLKKLFSLAMSIVLILSLSLPALAQETDGTIYSAVVCFAEEADTQQLCEKMEALPGVRVRWVYSSLINGAAIEGTRAALVLAGKQAGVSELTLSRTWSAPDTVKDPLSPSNSLDIMNMTDCEYDGDGMVIAVVDSGIRITHEAFDEYGNMDDITLTREDIENFVAQGGTDGRYISEKIPFAYDYSGQDRSVHTSDHHGTHVSALAVGYALREDGSVKFRGAASAAQLLCMKVFPDDASRGAADTDILKAIDDAYLLGADVINLSLGYEEAFLQDEQIGQIYSKVIAQLEAAGVVVVCAVGNSGTSVTGKTGDTALPSSGYTDYSAAGAPAIYVGAQAIGAVNSDFYEAGGGLLVGEYAISYTEVISEVEGEVLPSILELAGCEMPYVLIGGLGSKEDFVGLDLTGCAAVVQRGELYFSEKANNAAAAGAALCIIYNNEPGVILPAADGITIPCVMITQEAGSYFVEQAENGRGTLIVAPRTVRVSTGNGMTMFSHSAWGATADLRLVPTLCAPGGTILSAGVGADDVYDYLTGTSMAAPNASGAYATVMQALREQGVTERTQRARLAKALLESTATLLKDENGVFLSPRRQGAGVVDVTAALQSGAVITQPIVELGDNESGRFEISFSVQNLSDERKTFDVDTSVLTDAFVFAEGTMRSALAPMDITDQVSVSGISKISLAAGEERTVTLQLKVPLKTARYLSEVFYNGFFVEGYVTLTDQEQRSIHATFMGYCGDWEAAPILDCVDFRDVMNAYYDKEMGNEGAAEMPVADMGYNLAHLCGTDLDAYYALMPGENPWLVVLANDARNAMSNALSDGLIHGGDQLVVDLYTLRNAERMIFVVFDQRTGEIYTVDDRDYLTRSTVLDVAGVAEAAVRFAWDGMDFDGELLPGGTTVTVAVYAWLETQVQLSDAYESHRAESRKGNYRWLLGGEFDDALEWSFPLMMDTAAPDVQCRVNDGDAVTLAVADDHFVAYFAVQDGNGDYLAEEAYADTISAAAHKETVALPEDGMLYITVVDYAGNTVGYEVDTTKADSFGAVQMQRCPMAMLVDVEKNAWYHDAVDFVIERGLMTVGDELTFSPKQGALRISILEMLYALAGSPQVEPESVTLPFEDVSSSARYRTVLEWAYREGIVTGYSDELFGAYAPVQRAQLAAMLYRAAKAAGKDVGCGEDALSGFADADTLPQWAREALGWAVESGYLAADENGNIAGSAYVTRAECAYLLMMFYENQNDWEDINNGTE